MSARSCALMRCRRWMPRIDDLDVNDLRRIIGPVVSRISGQPRDLLYHVEVFALSEDRVFPIQVRRGHLSNEELRTVGVRSGIRHRQAARRVEGQVGLNSSLKLYPGS